MARLSLLISAVVRSSFTLKEPFDLPPTSSGASAWYWETIDGPFSSETSAAVAPETTLIST